MAGLAKHPEFGLVRYELHALPDLPDEQVAGTIALMRRYVLEDACSAPIQRQARSIAASVASLSGPDLAQAVFSFVRSRVSFSLDESISSAFHAPVSAPIIEALIRPVDMAVLCEDGGCRRMGDCDDFSMYVAALLLALGINCSFVTLAADPADPNRYSHVYVAAYTEAGRIPIDASHGEKAGWEAENKYGKKKEWPLKESRWETPFLAAVILAAGVYGVYLCLR